MGVPWVADPQLKVPVVRRPEYTLYLEQGTRRFCFVHCDVHGRWSPRIKRELRRDWEALKAIHGGPFYALHDPGDTKHFKFLQLFGITRWVRRHRMGDGRWMEIFST